MNMADLTKVSTVLTAVCTHARMRAMASQLDPISVLSRTAVVISLCTLLGACGNKGDLFLEEVELSAEQQQLLDDLDDEDAKKKKAEQPSTPESSVPQLQ